MNEEDDFDVILSDLTHVYEEDGKRVTVEIYSDGEGKWILEVLDSKGNSFINEDHFVTEQNALDEFQKDVKENGIDAFIGNA